MKRKQKAYSEKFRREAVRLAESGAKPLTQIARELGVPSGDAPRVATTVREGGEE